MAEFKKSVDALVRDLRNSERLPGVERIHIPGEGSHAARADRVKNGVPMPPSLMAALDTLAAELGIAPLGQ